MAPQSSLTTAFECACREAIEGWRAGRGPKSSPLIGHVAHVVNKFERYLGMSCRMSCLLDAGGLVLYSSLDEGLESTPCHGLAGGCAASSEHFAAPLFEGTKLVLQKRPERWVVFTMCSGGSMSPRWSQAPRECRHPSVMPASGPSASHFVAENVEIFSTEALLHDA